MAADEGHSDNEPRLFCIARRSGGILTVRFTYRATAFESLVRDTGGKAGAGAKPKETFALARQASSVGAKRPCAVVGAVQLARLRCEG